MLEPIRWEITREELKARYGRYWPVVFPVLSVFTISMIFLAWQDGKLEIILTVFGVVYLFCTWWIVHDYNSHPHVYEISDSGIIFNKVGSLSRHFSWSEFQGYSVSTDVQGSIKSFNPRYESSISDGDLNNTLKKAEKIFGPTYYLIRQWRWYTLWPYSGSVWINVEPDVWEKIHEIISRNLTHISISRINRRAENAGTFIGLVLGTAIITFAILSY